MFNSSGTEVILAILDYVIQLNSPSGFFIYPKNNYRQKVKRTTEGHEFLKLFK